MIAKFTLISGSTKSARIDGRLRNDAAGSRSSILYSILAELGALGGSVCSGRESLGYVGVAIISALHKVANNTSGHFLRAGKKLPALDGGIDSLLL